MATPGQVEEARQFVRAFGPTAMFTVRFVSKDKKHGEKFQSMASADFMKQIDQLVLKSHTEQKHLFVCHHGSNIVMLDADDEVSSVAPPTYILSVCVYIVVYL